MMDDRWVVSFDPKNGESAWYVTVPKGKTVTEPNLKKRDGRAFSGWFDESGRLWSFADPVDADMTLTARWEEDAGERRTVTFDPNNGDPTWSVAVPKGSAVTGTEEPSRDGWKFIGWYNGETPWDPKDNTDGDMTLTAMWIESSKEEENEFAEGPAGTSIPEILMSAMAFILLVQSRSGPKVVGTVKQNGEGVPDATVKYKMDGKADAVTTDSFGRFVIPVSIGTKMEIVSVDGRGLTDALAVTVQKKLTEVNIKV